uniref:U2A'/phosphoprotein 32 family A C-terminal domain-containing protein n=1 Tax=Monopterus albus TaxID=43700 RepID=A0A3Q3KH52_MONAL
MDHHTSGQHNQCSHALSFQWLSFAYQSLTEIPYETILTQKDTLEVLDLSYNLPYWNPALLGQLERLSTLIMDCNNYTSHVKFPYMPSVTTVCINKNKINNLPVFVEEIRQKFPNIKILSMMNNEAAPSYFNGGSLTQYKDYRQYVISQIPGLEILDDTEVMEKERAQARKTYGLQQSSHGIRKRKEASSRKHTHEANGKYCPRAIGYTGFLNPSL